VPAAALAEVLRVTDGFDLAGVDPADTPGFAGGRRDAEQSFAEDGALLSTLQERLWAGGVAGSRRSLLLLVQGMNTAGKGRVLRDVAAAVDPRGLRVASFAAPTAKERTHEFLWRVRRCLPGPGELAVFARSHYEDVLVARVHHLVPRATWQRRYTAINRFESSLVLQETVVVKIMLHLSAGEQSTRLAWRLQHPDLRWRYDPRDVEERAWWNDYQEAYQAALTRCSTEAAPWYVVPADRAWYARWAVRRLLVGELTAMGLEPVPTHVDVQAEVARLTQG